MPKTDYKECSTCSGLGRVPCNHSKSGFKMCFPCDGKGKIKRNYNDPPDFYSNGWVV